MDLELEARNALVLGGGGGLGSAIARGLAAEGARVAVAARQADAARHVTEELSARGHCAYPVCIDIGEPASFEQALADVREAMGDIDILVNLTGGPPPTAAAGVTPEQWSEQFRSMVLGVIHLTDLVLPAMRARGFGRIITSTSSGVVAPIPNLGISNALRMSLVGWSKTLASEVASDGVTVNVLIPGRINTQRVRHLDHARAQRENKSVEEVTAASAASIPMQRYGHPDEYAAAAVFLASARASYITGTTLRVDGGLIPAI